MKSYLAKNNEVKREWWVVDAEGQILGRLASKIAQILRGKTKPEFTPTTDVGDFVIVINADKIKVTGKKESQKMYYRHSGIPGGFKEETLGSLKKRIPERVIEVAVRGMIPHNTLGQEQFLKLKVYKGTTHPHASQHPKVLEIASKRR